MRQYYQWEVSQGVSNCTYLGGTLVPRCQLVRRGLTLPRLRELRFGRRLHRGRVLGYQSIVEPGKARDPKGGECLTEGELLHIIQVGLSLPGNADQFIFMHGVDEHEACHLLWVGRSVQLHNQPPKGVAHQDIGTWDASPGQERVQFRDDAPSRAWQGARVAPPQA